MKVAINKPVGDMNYNMLEVKADYSKAGMNYFDGSEIKNGMYVHVHASVYENGGSSFMIGGGDVGSFKFFVFPMKRNSKKKVAEFNAMLENLDKAAVASAFEKDDKKAIYNMVMDVLGLEKKVAA